MVKEIKTKYVFLYFKICRKQKVRFKKSLTKCLQTKSIGQKVSDTLLDNFPGLILNNLNMYITSTFK